MKLSMLSSRPLKNARAAIARIAIRERMSAYSARPWPSSRRGNKNKVASFHQNSLAVGRPGREGAGSTGGWRVVGGMDAHPKAYLGTSPIGRVTIGCPSRLWRCLESRADLATPAARSRMASQVGLA